MAAVAPVHGSDQHKELVAELRKSVHAALVSKAKGTSTAAYSTLVRDLSLLKRRLEADPGDCEAEFSLAQLLRALTGCVSSLRERRHDALLAEVLGMRVWALPKGVRAVLLEALVNLMVANGAFLHNCLQALLAGLVPPPAQTAAVEDEAGSEWRPSAQAVEVQGQVLEAVEKALQLIPTLPSQLLPMLLQNLPHKSRPREAQCLYLRAALLLAERPAGAPLREGLLLGVVDHLLALDVEVKWEDIVDAKTGQEQEEGSSSDEEDHEDIFELEGMQELDIHGVPILRDAAAAAAAAAGRPGAPRGGWEGSGAAAGVAAAAGAAAAAGVESGAGPSGRPPVDEAVDKLDSLMELVLEHLGRRCAAGELDRVWNTLLAAFERSLLHTHRSKFTQYLVFRACSEDPGRCCAAFVQALLARLGDARQAPVTRAAAAAYLASFLARCALAPEALVVEVLQRLARGCADYAAGVPTGGRAGGAAKAGVVTLGAAGGGAPAAAAAAGVGGAAAAQRHPVFYAMVQALLYVLCYHLGPLVRQQRQHPGASPTHAAAVKALVRQQVVPLLSHPRLAPLAVCLPSVSAEFARQAAALKLADLSPLLAGAQGQQQNGGGGSGGGGEAAAAPLHRPAVRPLEMFFPFDPYLLRRSSRFLNLDKTYVRWRGGHPEGGGAAGGGQEGEEEDVEAGGAAAAGGGLDDPAVAGGGASSEDDGSSESESDLEDSSSNLDDLEDHHMAASLDGPGGLSPPDLGLGLGRGAGGAAAARGGAAAGAAAMHRAASIGGLRPVGVAAAAAARQQARRMAAAGMSLSGPSPDALMLGTSILSSEGLGHSFGAAGHAPAPGGASLDDGPPLAFRAGLAAAASPAPSMGGAGTPLGASPAPMSYTTYDASYMHSIPARLDGMQA